jgi:hypothetical protein
MRLRAGVCSIIAAGSLAMSPWQIQAQTAMPNLSGNYRCEPQPMSCRSGQAFAISQSGNALELKNDKGEQGNGHLTSATTVSAGPPWNMLGVLYDGAIEWSNGTKWYKQQPASSTR